MPETGKPRPRTPGTWDAPAYPVLVESADEWSVERHLADKPKAVVDFYQRFVALVAACGPYTVSVTKTAIAFKGTRRGAPYLKQIWTDNDGAPGRPIIADRLVWTIAGDAVHGLNPTNGHQVVSIPFGGYANHFPTPSVGDGLLLLPGTDQVFAFMGPAGLPSPPSAQ